jgi:hypothetical protein
VIELTALVPMVVHITSHITHMMPANAKERGMR